MPTKCSGLTLIETLIAAVILFMTVAVVSNIFAVSAKRAFVLKVAPEEARIVQLASFEAVTGEHLEGAPEVSREEDESTLTVSFSEGNATVDVKVEKLIVSGCPRCPPLIKKLSLSKEVREELVEELK